MEWTTEALSRRSPRADRTYDVIVAGGGPAGIGAAAAAARMGASTLLLEARSQFGGTATAALWMCINWLFTDDAEHDRGGIHRMLVERIRAKGPDASVIGRREGAFDGGNLDVHPDYFELVVFELLEELGIDYQLYSPVAGAIVDHLRLTRVKVAAKEGLVPYGARAFVDATGDGDVAWLSGCDMVEGREEDSRHMPITVVFALANVDTERLFAWWRDKASRDQFRAMVEEERAAGRHAVTTWYSFDPTTVPGVVSVNNGGVSPLSFDACRSADLTAAERLGAQVAVDFVALARSRGLPGLERCSLVRSGAFAAIRDTRRILGEYVLTEADIMEGREFPDVIARKYGYMDAVGFKSGPAIKQGAAYPYRSMLPRPVEGLLVAGRCGSATFLGHSGGKSMGNMLAIGQAAGVAAALSAQAGIFPRKLDPRLVQEALADKLDAKLTV
jgi:hypothetical protein